MLSITEKAAFFQILLLKSLLLFGAVTDYYRSRTENRVIAQCTQSLKIFQQFVKK